MSALGPRADGLHPELVSKLERVHAAMAALGYPMILVEGVRSQARQQTLYAQGRTKPGKIVTQVDGVTKRSNHQVKADGYGYAADCAFKDDKRTPRDETWDESMPWQAYGALAEALGLVWGGRWPTLRDLPHVELRR